MTYSFAFSLLVLCGCASRPPAAVVICWPEDLRHEASKWQAAFAARHGGMVPNVLGAHGGDHNGSWTLEGPDGRWDAAGVARGIRAALPGRPLLVVCCNPGHYRPALPAGVYYATDDMWTAPGEHWRQLPGQLQFTGSVGGVEDLVEGK